MPYIRLWGLAFWGEDPWTGFLFLGIELSISVTSEPELQAHISRRGVSPYNTGVRRVGHVRELNTLHLQVRGWVGGGNWAQEGGWVGRALETLILHFISSERRFCLPNVGLLASPERAHAVDSDSVQNPVLCRWLLRGLRSLALEILEQCRQVGLRFLS